MAIVMGQVQVPGNGTVAAFTLPPGYCNFLVYQPSSPQAVYVGSSVKVSSGNGMQVTVTPFNGETYSVSGGATWYATTGNATAATLNYLISSTSLKDG